MHASTSNIVWRQSGLVRYVQWIRCHVVNVRPSATLSWFWVQCLAPSPWNLVTSEIYSIVHSSIIKWCTVQWYVIQEFVIQQYMIQGYYHYFNKEILMKDHFLSHNQMQFFSYNTERLLALSINFHFALSDSIERKYHFNVWIEGL
jgi:hypothetical protein